MMFFFVLLLVSISFADDKCFSEYAYESINMISQDVKIKCNGSGPIEGTYSYVYPASWGGSITQNNPSIRGSVPYPQSCTYSISEPRSIPLKGYYVVHHDPSRVGSIFGGIGTLGPKKVTDDEGVDLLKYNAYGLPNIMRERYRATYGGTPRKHDPSSYENSAKDKVWSSKMVRYFEFPESAKFARTYETNVSFKDALNNFKHLLSTTQGVEDYKIFVSSIDVATDVNPETFYFFDAVVKLGTEKLIHYPFGRYIDPKKENLAGYGEDEKLYFASPKTLPYYPLDASFNSLGPPQFSMRGGAPILTEKEFKALSKEERDAFPSYPFCLHSDMLSNWERFDENGLPLPALKGKYVGYAPPIPPDYFTNTNHVLLKECPDMNTYYQDYKICVDAKLAMPKATEPSEMADYLDYLDKRLRGSNYDANMYYANGLVEGKKMSIDNPPQASRYYDKNTKRLNPESFEEGYLYAPDASVFYTYEKMTHTKWFGKAGIPNWVKKKKYVNSQVNTYKSLCSSLFSDLGKKKGWDLIWSSHPPFKGGINKVNYNDFLSNYKAYYNFLEKYPDWKPPRQDGRIIDTLMETPEDAPSYLAYKPTLKTNVGVMKTSTQFTSEGIDSMMKYPTKPVMHVNPHNSYRNYESHEEFCTESEARGQLPLAKRMVDANKITDDLYFHYIYHKYPLAIYDEYENPILVGYTEMYFGLSDDRNMPDVAVDLDRNKALQISSNQFKKGHDVYDRNSKEYSTDQKDLAERDPQTFGEKKDAIIEIAKHIAVSEGFDILMHVVYEERKDVYKFAKALEEYMGVKSTYKYAKLLYDLYNEWKTMMDILAEIRDAKRALDKAWYWATVGSGQIVKHYRDLEWSKLRPTNITRLFPYKAMRDFDYSLTILHRATVNYLVAMDALAFDLDRFSHGPGKQAMAWAYKNMSQNQMELGVEMQDHVDDIQNAIESEAKSHNKNSVGESFRLSAFTENATQQVQNTRLRVLNSGTMGVYGTLLAIEMDSKDWIMMKNYTTNMLSNFPQAIISSNRAQDLSSLAKNIEPPRDLFDNSWTDDKYDELHKKTQDEMKEKGK